MTHRIPTPACQMRPDKSPLPDDRREGLLQLGRDLLIVVITLGGGGGRRCGQSWSTSFRTGARHRLPRPSGNLRSKHNEIVGTHTLSSRISLCIGSCRRTSLGISPPKFLSFSRMK